MDEYCVLTRFVWRSLVLDLQFTMRFKKLSTQTQQKGFKTCIFQDLMFPVTAA